MSEDEGGIGQRIRALRADAGWSQPALLEALHGAGLKWGQSTLSKVESGERPLRLSEAQKVAAALSLDDVNELFPPKDEWARIVGTFAAAVRDLSKEVTVYEASLDQAKYTLSAVEQLSAAAAGRSSKIALSERDIGFALLDSQLATVLRIARALGANEAQLSYIRGSDTMPAQKELMSSPTEYAVMRFAELLPELLPQVEFGVDDGS